MPDHGLPPKIRHTHIEWPGTREATRSAGTKARAELWARTVERADQRVGGGRLSLVGAVESAAAGLDALDPQAFQVKPGDRETTALDQSPADGPRLAAKKNQQRRRIYGRTKPGYLLKHHIPVKTDSWDVKSPGFTEVDLVSHSGNSGEGEFGYSLNITDIQTTWTETRALLGKGQTAVQQALDEIEGMLPFQLLGLDSDNGSEFINWHLKAWCERKQIQLTRGRPYKKDDNAHIEQKNWTHVRKLLGWERYDTQNAVDAMNDLYRRELRLWLNLYLPSVKLLKKIHVGSKLRRVYDGPKTPFERVVASKQGDTAQLTILKELRRSLDPFQLAKVIDRKLERIYRLANRRLSPKVQEKLESSQAQSGRRKGCGKDARFTSLEIPSGFPLSHSHNNNKRSTGYISNGSTGSARVTFLDGLTGKENNS